MKSSTSSRRKRNNRKILSGRTPCHDKAAPSVPGAKTAQNDSASLMEVPDALTLPGISALRMMQRIATNYLNRKNSQKNDAKPNSPPD
jgi:hypothetical protein